MNVLIAFVGMSPAVVPETVWCLANRPGEPLRIDRLVIITTRKGREILKEQLLSAPNHVLERLIRQLKLSDELAQVGEKLEILVPSSDLNSEDEDVEAEDELDRMGDLIFKTIKFWIDWPDSRVILSLSGGRKTMSHLGGTVFSLLARPHDFMTHITVMPERLEDCPDFFYPDPDIMGYWAQETHSHDAEYISTDVIQLRLRTVPFLRLADKPEIQRLVNTSAQQHFFSLVCAANPTPKIQLIYKNGQFLLNDQALDAVKDDNGKLCMSAPFVDTAALLLICKNPEAVGASLNFHQFKQFMLLWRHILRQRVHNSEIKANVDRWRVVLQTVLLNSSETSALKSSPNEDFLENVDENDARLASYNKDVKKIQEEISRVRKAISFALPSHLAPEAYKIQNKKVNGKSVYALPDHLIFIES